MHPSPISIALFCAVAVGFGLALAILDQRSVVNGKRLADIVKGERPQQFHKKTSVMNKSEAAFLYELQRQLPEGYYIFPKMRIADIIETDHGAGYYHRRNSILPKHIDFLVCDRNFKPVVAIEVNGSSHRRQDRKDRDRLVSQIFNEAKMPLEFVEVGSSFAVSIERIKTLL